jgi:ribosome biogenesis GTPase A
MKSYWGIVNEVIKRADVLLLILDARQPYDSMNREIAEKATLEGKPLIYVVTKADLVPESDIKSKGFRFKPCVFVSSKTNYGIDELFRLIFVEAKKQGLVRVGVFGCPNVGKSCLINAMKGREVARVSSLSGYTKFAQKVRVRNRLLIIDTPGVISDSRKDFMKAAIVGTLDHTHVKEPEVVVVGLFEKFPGRLEAFYGVKKHEDYDETLDEIAIKRKIMRKGNIPDRIKMARMILSEWHKGIIKL